VGEDDDGDEAPAPRLLVSGAAFVKPTSPIVERGEWKLFAGGGLYETITGLTRLAVGKLVSDGSIRRLREAIEIIRKTLRSLIAPTVMGTRLYLYRFSQSDRNPNRGCHRHLTMRVYLLAITQCKRTLESVCQMS